MSHISVQPPDYLMPLVTHVARSRLSSLADASANGRLFENNVMGILGELASVVALERTLPDTWRVRWVADSPETHSDVIGFEPDSRTYRFEVKTFSPQSWLQSGRVIPADQLDSTDADVYIWCIWAPPESPEGLPQNFWPEIRVMGWSETAIVRRLRAPVHRARLGENTALPYSNPESQVAEADAKGWREGVGPVFYDPSGMTKVVDNMLPMSELALFVRM